MIAILGATNTGKTGIGVTLAKKFPMELISMDSRQIYRKFDVGTGKLPIGDKHAVQKYDGYWIIDSVNIWGYDLIDPHEGFSSYDFKKFAQLKHQEIEKRNHIPLYVGGTGFYYDAMNKLSQDDVIPDVNLRNRLGQCTLTQILELFPIEEINKLNSSERNNKRRLIRRYEVFSATGAMFPPQENIEANLDPIILTLPRVIIYEKVDKWVDAIWKYLLVEVEKLISEGHPNTIPMNGIIYRSVRDMFIKRGKSEEDAKQTVKYDIHAYIRRQETWFRRYKTAHIIDMSSLNSYNQVESIVTKYINGK